MSHTNHHNAPKAPRFLHRDDTYTGWKGEDCYAQNGRRAIKRQEHRANRRIGDRRMLEELFETLQ